MRQRALIEMHEKHPAAPLKDTYERVRRTLDDALAELELPDERNDGDRAQPRVLN